MKIENTTAEPLAVFYIPAGGERSATVLQPGEATTITLSKGDTVKTRIATEITDPVEPTPAAETDEAKEA